MEWSGLGWSLQTVFGAALLVIVLLWAVLRNRRRSAEERDRTERSTRDLYEEEDAARDKSDDGTV